MNSNFLSSFKFLTLLMISLSLLGCNEDDNSSTTTSTGDSSSVSGGRISGRILVASNTAKDNDINDPKAPALPSNNSMNSAQHIPNPVILGGYVNQPGAGYIGRSKTTGDTDDYFIVDLRVGQMISLSVANQNLMGNDLDLALFDTEGTVVNASIGEGATESLIVPGDGRYFVRVNAYLGASSYVLSIGQQTTPPSSQGLRLSDEFVPGEVIVQFKPENLLQAQSVMNSLGLQNDQQDFSRRQLLTIESHPSRLLAVDDLTFATPESRAKYETLMAVKQLRHREDVKEASPNYTLKMLRAPNDTLYRYQWNLPMMNLPAAWDTTVGDASVIVAVIDTGVLLNHPDLQGKLVSGYDFIRNVRVSLDGDAIDNYPDDPGDQSPNGSTFHGTHVAGSMAARTDNNNGIAGIGWQTKIMPLRVLGKGGAGNDYDIEQAMRFAAGLTNDSNTLPVRRADVINLSLGGPVISSGFQELVNDVRRAGVIVVAAAGNDGTDTVIYPASLDGVVSVSGVDINRKRATYSNYGPFVDVAAPGGDNTPDVNGDGVPDGIISTVGDEITDNNGKTKIEYTFASSIGTSMAAPQMAGVIALMKAVYPAMTPAQFDNLLSSGVITEDLGKSGRDDIFGHGLIDAQKAVMAAINLSGGVAPQPQPKLVVNPTSLNFGLGLSYLTLTVQNGGGGELKIQNVSENSEGFLSIRGQGFGDYTISIDRTRLNPGTFTATITIVSDVNTVRVPVILQVGDPSVTGDAGFHYILLVNPDTWEAVQETRANAVNGVYEFKFDNVKGGTYMVVAGSDINNDNYICDIGEACGAFLVVRDPTPITVNGATRLTDFSTGFDVSFTSKAMSEEVGIGEGMGRIRLLGKEIGK